MLVGAAVIAAVGLALALYFFRTQDAPAPADYSGGLQLKLLFVIDGPGTGGRPKFERPLGVAVAGDGTIFVSDTGNNRVCVFDSGGKYVREWGTFGIAKPLPGIAPTWRPGSLNFPVGIDVGDDDLVYVADFRNDQVSVFTQEGDFVRAFPDPTEVVGKGGSGQDGRGIAVTDVAASRDRVYATDTYQIVTFDSEGRFLSQFGRPGTGPNDLDHPSGVAAGQPGVVYVSDSNHARLAAFDSAGQSLWSTRSWETSGPAGDGEQRFDLPRGLTTVLDEQIVVTDATRHELVITDTDGNVLAVLGGRGVRPGEFNFPVDVDAYGSTLVVADKENNRVQVFVLTGVSASESEDESSAVKAGP